MILAGIVLRNKFRSSHLRLILCTGDHRKDAARTEARIRSAVAKKIAADPERSGPADIEAMVLATVRRKLITADKSNDHDAAHALALAHASITGSVYGTLIARGGDEYDHRPTPEATTFREFVTAIKG